MFFRYDYFDEARDYDKGNVGWYIIRVQNPDDAAEVAKRVDAEFANSPAETKTEPEGAFLQGFAKQIGNIGLIVSRYCWRAFLHHSAGGRQHHGAIRARTHRGIGRA